MIKNTQGQEQKSASLLKPILASIFLFLCLGAALFFLLGKTPGDDNLTRSDQEKQKERIALLQQKKSQIEKLAQQDPCVIRQTLGLPPVPPVPSPAASSQKNSSTPMDAIERIENATVFILSLSDTGLFTGTGFFITPDTIMTNYHVIGDAPSNIFALNRALKKPIKATLIGGQKDTEVGGRDYAILRVPPQSSIQPLLLCALPRRTDKINAWGYPHAISRNDPKYLALMNGQLAAAPDLVYSDGVVSSIIDRNPPLIAHTAPLSQGNSGGPLTNGNGMVVGINTLISLDDTSYRQTSMALPASDFINFLHKNGIAVTLAQPGEK